MLPVIEQCSPFVIAHRQPGEFSTGRCHPGIAGDLSDLSRQEPVILASWKARLRRRLQS